MSEDPEVSDELLWKEPNPNQHACSAGSIGSAGRAKTKADGVE